MHVWAAVKKYHRRTRVGIEPTTSWLLDRHHTTRPPRMHDGYVWFDSQNSSRYCIDLSFKDFRLGGMFNERWGEIVTSKRSSLPGRHCLWMDPSKIFGLNFGLNKGWAPFYCLGGGGGGAHPCTDYMQQWDIFMSLGGFLLIFCMSDLWPLQVYKPCVLQSKKRYVGYKYESPDQTQPEFEAKGIETVRRDSCSAVAKVTEPSILCFSFASNPCQLNLSHNGRKFMYSSLR